jgi:hypothetical protein
MKESLGVIKVVKQLKGEEDKREPDKKQDKKLKEYKVVKKRADKSG